MSKETTASPTLDWLKEQMPDHVIKQFGSIVESSKNGQGKLLSIDGLDNSHQNLANNQVVKALTIHGKA